MIQNNYSWEAELPDGSVMTEGEDLTKVVRFSLIPSNLFLPRHDIVGVPLVRRFCRGFLNGFNGKMKDYVHCVVAPSYRIYVKSSTGSVLITPPDYELYL